MYQQIGDVLGGQNPNQALTEQVLQKATSGSNYDPYQSPPDFHIAKLHGKAKRVYMSKQEDGKLESEKTLCPCCGLPAEGEELSLNAELSHMYHLGSGYSLYFQFIKCSIMLLFVFFIPTGIYNLYTSVTAGDCAVPSADDTSQYCVQDFISKFTIANKKDHDSEIHMQLVLNFVTICMVMVFFHYIRYVLRKMAITAEDDTITPSDYAVKLKNVPHITTDDEIRHWIHRLSSRNMTLNVRKIIRSYDLTEYNELVTEKNKLDDAKDKEQIQEKKQILSQQMLGIDRRIEEIKTSQLVHTGTAFVILETAQQSEYLCAKFRRGTFGKHFHKLANMVMETNSQLNGNVIKVKRAPEPSDILWENLGYAKSQKFKRHIMTNVMTAILVIISFLIIVALSWYEVAVLDNSRKGEILSMGASVFIVMVNYYLGQFIRKFAAYEKHGTYTGFFKGIAEKLSVAQFINTAFTTLAAKFLITSSRTVDQINVDDVNVFGKGGIVESMFFVFISNAFLTPIMTYFDVFHYLKLFSQWRAPKSPSTLNQMEAHAIYEGVTVDMSYKHALLIKTMLLTCFYAPAMPFALIITAVGLVLVYWADKYVLLRRAALPFALGAELATTMIEYLELSALAYSLGNLVFVFTLKNAEDQLVFLNSPHFLIWGAIAISAINLVLPMELVNKTLFPIKDDVIEVDTYDKARVDFYTDYDIENPITRAQALEEFKHVLHAAAAANNQMPQQQPRKINMKNNLRAKHLPSDGFSNSSPPSPGLAYPGIMRAVTTVGPQVYTAPVVEIIPLMGEEPGFRRIQTHHQPHHHHAGHHGHHNGNNF